MANFSDAYRPIVTSVLSAGADPSGSTASVLAEVLGANTSKADGAVLFVYDKTDPKLLGAEPIARFRYGPRARVVGVDSWDGLAAELRKYSTIDRLVVWVHGTAGSPLINGKDKSTTGLRDLLGATKVQVTGSITWEGCVMMQKPIDMSIAVSRIAGPNAVVTGYTYSMVVSHKTLDLPPGATIAQAQGLLDKDEGYWASEADAKKIAGKGKTEIQQIWFREDGRPIALPDEVAQRSEFVKASELKAEMIATPEDAVRFEAEQSTPAKHGAFKVTVTKIPAVAATKRPTPP